MPELGGGAPQTWVFTLAGAELEARQAKHKADWLVVAVNDDASVAALKGLGEDKLPHKLVVILGGDGKGQDFKPLAEPLARYCRAVAFIGRDAQAMDDAVGDRLAMASLPSQHFATLEEATRWAQSQALPGDAVLLSPACASLDMFRNYAHRAQVYVDTVQAISEEEGLA